jgi:hypothetical protein
LVFEHWFAGSMTQAFQYMRQQANNLHRTLPHTFLGHNLTLNIPLNQSICAAACIQRVPSTRTPQFPVLLLPLFYLDGQDVLIELSINSDTHTAWFLWDVKLRSLGKLREGGRNGGNISEVHMLCTQSLSLLQMPPFLSPYSQRERQGSLARPPGAPNEDNEREGYRCPLCRERAPCSLLPCSCRRTPPGCSSRTCRPAGRPGSASRCQLSQHHG